MRQTQLVVVLTLVAAVLGPPAFGQFALPPWDNDPGTVTRPGGEDPRSYAVALSQLANAEFDTFRILIVSDTVFADGLSASSLGGGTMFFATPGEELDEATLAEIARVRGDFTQAQIIGGSAAVDARVDGQLAALGLEVDRFSGPDRIATALAVADASVASFPSEEVLIARAFAPAGGPETAAWADSISGSSVAALGGTALLLTPTGSLDERVAAWLTTNQPARVTILGGEAAISTAVSDAIVALGFPVRRIAGPGRDTTAAQIMRQPLGGGFTPLRQVALVNLYDERGWTYALATSQAGFGAALLTINPDAPTAATQSLVACGPPADVVVAGPASLISDAKVQEARTCPDGLTYGIDSDAAFGLRGDGLGDTLLFGSRPDVVVERLTARLGEPTMDSGWLDDACKLAGPEDPPARFVSFDDLTVGFREVGGIQFFDSWALSGPAPDLATPEGLDVGQRNADVGMTYGADAIFRPGDDSFPPPLWTVQPAHGDLLVISDGNADEDPITYIGGGGVGFCE